MSNQKSGKARRKNKSQGVSGNPAKRGQSSKNAGAVIFTTPLGVSLVITDDNYQLQLPPHALKALCDESEAHYNRLRDERLATGAGLATVDETVAWLEWDQFDEMSHGNMNAAESRREKFLFQIANYEQVPLATFASLPSGFVTSFADLRIAVGVMDERLWKPSALDRQFQLLFSMFEAKLTPHITDHYVKLFRGAWLSPRRASMTWEKFYSRAHSALSKQDFAPEMAVWKAPARVAIAALDLLNDEFRATGNVAV